MASIRAEPIMLKTLPIILSRISQIFDPLSLFYSHIITYYIPTYSCSLYVKQKHPGCKKGEAKSEAPVMFCTCD